MENKKKYPRSHHLHYSQKSSSDDKIQANDNHFIGKNVVVSIKMDGENTTIYNDYIHARSLNSNIDSEDRRWIDALRKSKIENNIPDSYRICGENLFYKHAIYYDDLKSMFYVFSIWDNDVCLSWEETKLWCVLLDLCYVPIIYEGEYNREIIINEFNNYVKIHNNTEGFVVRLADEFNINNFEKSLNKYVRDTFKIPNNHWKYSKKTLNKLLNGKNPWEII